MTMLFILLKVFSIFIFHSLVLFKTNISRQFSFLYPTTDKCWNSITKSARPKRKTQVMFSNRGVRKFFSSPELFFLLFFFLFFLNINFKTRVLCYLWNSIKFAVRSSISFNLQEAAHTFFVVSLHHFFLSHMFVSNCVFEKICKHTSLDYTQYYIQDLTLHCLLRHLIRRTSKQLFIFLSFPLFVFMMDK